jgi:hypothetical protein
MNSFVSFPEARNIVRSLGLKTCKEWIRYSKSSEFNPSLSKAPDYFYKEWTNWYDFLGRNRDARKHIVNDAYFKTWTHNMAYILGLWFADGCITKGSIFSIKLHESDEYLLLEILKELKSDYKLIKESGEKSSSACFQINSREIYSDIIRLGGKERKSLDVKFPDIPSQYLPDFIRGLWDGDGTINPSARRKDGKGIGYHAALASGSKEFILKLKTILEEKIEGLESKIYEHFSPAGTKMAWGGGSSKDSTVYNLSLSPNNAKKLRDFMYFTPSTLKLIRKYESFLAAGDYKPGPGDMNYMPFEDAKKLMAEKQFGSMHDYHRWLKSPECTVILPANPNVVYEEWKTWTDFLGHYRVSYEDLSRLAIENNLSGRREYKKWARKMNDGARGRYPSHPENTYNEWVSWDAFLGRKDKILV